MDAQPQTPPAGAAQRPSILERVKSILLRPREAWPAIADEPASVAGLYTGYFMLLAAIPAVAGFIKGSLIGHSLFGVTVATPVMAGLAGMVVGYVLGLALLYVMALIVNALAPTFGGEKDQVQALKAVGYAWTAAWVAGIAVILPWLGVLLAFAGGVYSIYLLYLGLPHTMKCPPGKSLAYTAVTVVIAIVLGWILGLLVAAVSGAGAIAAGALGSGAGSPRVSVDRDSPLGQMVEFGKRMEEAGRQVEQARAGGDSAAGGEAALGAVVQAMAGAAAGSDGTPAEAVAPDALRALLPETLGGLRRNAISSRTGGAAGMQISEATAEYVGGDGGQRIEVGIRDMAAMSGMLAMAGAFGIDESSESDGRYERTYVRDGRLVNEDWDSNRGYGSYMVTVGNRFQIEAQGSAGGIDDLKALVSGLERQVASLQ